jgi:two-component system, chemotaxis family, CheB/CheR fusion protein
MLKVLETLSVKELEVQTQDGHWYTLRIRPYRTREDKIEGVVLVLLDIDALKRSAVTLEAARNYAEAIVETVQVPLVVLDPDFRVSKANRSFYEKFEVSPAETARSLFFYLGNGQWNIPELRSRLEDILANDTTVQNFEVEHYFENIGQKTMLLNALRIVGTGAAQRILLAIEDISGRKQFELARSYFLRQEQSARQAAEAANQAKEEFLSNLSHELRNPLSAMLGWANILRTHQLSETASARALETIERNARAQSQLVEDMLDSAQISSGKLSLNLCQLDLLSVVESAIQSIQLAAEAKSIQIVSQLSSVIMAGDIDRLQQVLWNLLSNAIKFTPTGGQVSVTLEPIQSDAEIRVSDTGQGMSAELLPYIFDRFRQGDSTTTKASQGLGLGLSIVRQVIELHGGTVRAQSLGEGQGSTLIARLPLISGSTGLTGSTGLIGDEATGHEIVSSVSSITPAVSATSLEGLHLLIVDDNVDSLNLMKFMLEDAGAEVTTRESAQGAIAALTSSPQAYDVLLADIGMPDEDGFSLIRKIRVLDADIGGRIPAVAVTAYVNDQEQQMAADAGFQAHITKPIDWSDLLSAIVNLTR